MPKRSSVIVKQIYDAWLAHDLETVAGLLPDDFSHDLLIPTDIHPLGGLYKGRAAIDRIRAVAAEFDFLKFDTSSLIAEVNRVAVEIPIYYRHRETGVFLQTTFVDFWTFEDGRPVKLVEYHDVPRMQDFMTNVAHALVKV
jgi:ketosteroid isomerase-like protein